MNHLGRLFLFAAALVFAVPTFADTIDIGPKIGAKIPTAFAARDQKDVAKNFTDITGSKGVVIAFVRSAKWCPYCQAQLKDLQAIAGALSERGYPLVSLSYDPPDILAGFAEKTGITYTMLSDKGSVIIDAFDIRDPQYKEGSFAYGVPKPAIFIIDKAGTVRAKLAEDGYKTRPQIASIVTAVENLSK